MITDFITAPNRPSAQARHLVAAMEDVEKRITERFQQALDSSASTLNDISRKMDGLGALTSKLEEIENRQREQDKIVQYLQAKLDLSMKSLAQVSQNQIRLTNAVNNAAKGAGATQMHTSDGLMGARPPMGPRTTQVSHTTPPVSPVVNEMGSVVPNFEADFGHGNEGEIDSDTRGRRGWLPKMDFPIFDGDDVRIWIDNCESYFLLYSILEGFKVTAASLNLKGRVAHWFQVFRDTIELFDWSQFKTAVLTEFEVSTHSDKMLELLTLKQTGSIMDYKVHFEKLVYHIKLFDKAISETFLVAQFLLGLKWEIRAGVELQFPQTLSMAAQLALKHEALQSRQMPSARKAAVFKTPSVNNGKEVPESQGEIWKAKQLKEYRRINGLCYRCGEKFVPGHKCKAPGQPQLNQIAMDDTGDGGPILEDEVLNYLETLESKADEEITVSIHAMDGTDNSNCIRLRALIRNQVMLQLLDSGSSNTFVSELTLSRLECVIQAIDPVSVKVANGQVIQCIKKAKGLEWWCSGRTFHVDAFVLPVAAYDMILGWIG